MTSPDTHAASAGAGADTPLARLQAHLNTVLIGQRTVVEHVLVCLLAGGHALVEGAPGLGKTRLVKAIATACGGDFKRLQFTPDLMPSDIVGHAVFDRDSGQFSLRKGPIFTHFVVADEINRAPAKTQSAMLEAMEEGAVSLEGETLPLPRPFMVLATQNPLDHEGTYALPQAQNDRFLMQILIDFPALEDEITMVRSLAGNGEAVAEARPVLDLQRLRALQRQCGAVRVDDALIDYAVRLVQGSRELAGLEHGAGPRASLALVATARARALLAGRDYATPDDIKAVLPPVLQHRIALGAELEIQGVGVASVLAQLLDNVPAPRQ